MTVLSLKNVSVCVCFILNSIKMLSCSLENPFAKVSLEFGNLLWAFLEEREVSIQTNRAEIINHLAVAVV